MLGWGKLVVDQRGSGHSGALTTTETAGGGQCASIRAMFVGSLTL